MKGGFSGDQVPKVIFPTLVGKPKLKTVMVGTGEKDFFVGEDAQQKRGVLALTAPMKHGVVVDWEGMGHIYHHMFNKLKIDPAEHGIMVTEAPFNLESNRIKLAELLFETHKVPAFYVSINAALSLFGSGKTSGVILDIGEGIVTSVPIIQGRVAAQGMQRLDFGGANLTDYMLERLRTTQGQSFHTYAERQIVQHLKESTGYASQNPTADKAHPSTQ